MIDCHLHLQDPRLAADLGEILATARSIGIGRFIVNGTGPDDWKRVAELAAGHPEVTPSFGLHPWKVGKEPADWLEDLESRLLDHPDAGVGEIGLDRWIEGHDLDRQARVFVSQMELAVRLERPLSIHCLRAWGRLHEILSEKPPTTGFLLHSYGGPAEMVERFVELGAYFSISGYFLHPSKASKLAVFDRVPRDRILLETDAPDMTPPTALRPYLVASAPAEAGDRTPNHPANLVAIHAAVAERWEMTPGELEQLVARNFQSWWYGRATA